MHKAVTDGKYSGAVDWHDSAVGGKETQLHDTMYIKLKGTEVSEASQTQKATSCTYVKYNSTYVKYPQKANV